jgi:CHAD domain-containing protein
LVADAEMLAAKVSEAVRRLGPFTDTEVLEQIADDAEIVGEIVELHGHALAIDRLARERLGA